MIKLDGLGEPRWIPPRDRSRLVGLPVANFCDWGPGSHLMYPSPSLWQEPGSPGSLWRRRPPSRLCHALRH